MKMYAIVGIAFGIEQTYLAWTESIFGANGYFWISKKDWVSLKDHWLLKKTDDDQHRFVFYNEQDAIDYMNKIFHIIQDPFIDQIHVTEILEE